MEKLKQEVDYLKKRVFHEGVLLLDKNVLRRILELRDHFDQVLIGDIEYRIRDSRTNKEILKILDKQMQIEVQKLHIPRNRVFH